MDLRRLPAARDRATLPHQHARVAQRVRTLYRKLHLDRRTASLSLQLICNPTLRASAALVSMKLCRVASFSASFARLAWRPRQSISGKRKSR